MLRSIFILMTAIAAATANAAPVFTATNRTTLVSGAAGLQPAIDAAPDGSHILIGVPISGVSVTVSGKRLVIEKLGNSMGSLAGVTRPQFSYPEADGEPAVNVVGGGEVVFRNLTIIGGGGRSRGSTSSDFGLSGGNGAPGVVGDSSTVAFVNCQVIGGNGGDAEFGGIETYGSGGNGAPGVRLQGGAAYADEQTMFYGSSGGDATCDHTGQLCGTSGSGAPPVIGGTVQVGPIDLFLEIDAADRALGDFDSSGSLDIADFLFLLDYWQLPAFVPILGLNDFLLLLDNWGAFERRISASPPSLTFPTAYVGDGPGNAQTLTLNSIGTLPITITAVVAPSDFPYSGEGTLGPLPAVIPAGEGRTLIVRFDPKAVGTRSFSLKITSDDTTGHSTSLVAATGAAIAHGLSYDPVSVNFGSVLVDGTGGEFSTRTVRLINTDPAPVTLDSMPYVTILSSFPIPYAVTGGTLSGATFPYTIPSSSEETVIVTFDPTWVNPSSIEALLHVLSNLPSPGTHRTLRLFGNAHN